MIKPIFKQNMLEQFLFCLTKIQNRHMQIETIYISKDIFDYFMKFSAFNDFVTSKFEDVLDKMPNKHSFKVDNKEIPILLEKYQFGFFIECADNK